MKLGIVVNVMDSVETGATTYRFAAEAMNMDHEVWVMSSGNLSYNPDDSIAAFARAAPPGRFTSARLLEVLKINKATNKWITLVEPVQTGCNPVLFDLQNRKTFHQSKGFFHEDRLCCKRRDDRRRRLYNHTTCSRSPQTRP